MIPSAQWLGGNGNAVWVSTQKLPALKGRTIDTSGWSRQEQDARVIQVTNELSGPVRELGKRLQTLIGQQAPEVAELLANDRVISLSYSDRYLKSPWSLMLLSGFLDIFKNSELKSLSIQTLAASSGQTSSLISHDWLHAADQESVLSLWLGSQFSLQPTINIKEHTRDLQHSREISVVWASGKRCKIFLDQGMGYWRGRMPHRAQMGFDFYSDYKGQAMQRLEKYKDASMAPSGDWSTYISVVVG